MRDAWTRIERWLEAHAPEPRGILNPGASEEEIAALEREVGLRLPDDVRESLRIHDGQAPDAPGLINACELLSTARIAGEWRAWKELLDGGDFDDAESDPAPGIRGDWWNAAWIPLTHDFGGNHDCLDLDPAPGGRAGQIISMWHDDAERRVLAGSFREWLSAFADGLENGDYVYSEEYDAVVRADDV